MFPPGLVLSPVRRRPLALPEATEAAVLRRPVPAFAAPPAGSPRASIVVVTFGHLLFTRLCLESVLANTEGIPYELLVVDNGSADGTAEYLCALALRNRAVRALFAGRNLGFAAAVNRGLEAAAGGLLVVLNNDTMTPPRWLVGLERHLERPELGLLGPVTNRTCNQAQIDAPYGTYGELLRFARERARTTAPRAFGIRSLAMFCAAMRRDAYERIGPLDERFEVGLFEDDDYAMRARARGLRVACAEDVFVHHFGQASFSALVPGGEYGRVLEANRRRFEAKWDLRWRPHEHRRSPGYRRLLHAIRLVVRRTLPPDAAVLVVSKGDAALIRLGGPRARHFPDDERGAWSGHHPAGSGEAIERLEQARARGGEFLLVPRTAFWWLDHYAGFRRHLERRYDRAAHEPDVCSIWALGAARSARP